MPFFCTALDLGSGGGINAFLAAQKGGESGKVNGVDKTKEIIQKAEANAQKYGYKNFEFKLTRANKEQVFQEAFIELKPNGRSLISDIVTDGELTEAVKKNISVLDRN